MSQTYTDDVLSSAMVGKRCHIAMLTRIFSDNGGLELYTHRLIEGLLNKGFTITVICEHSHSQLTHNNLSVVQIASARKGSTKSERLDFYFHEFSNKLKELGPFDVVHSQHIAAQNVDIAHFHNHTVHRIIQNGKFWESFLNRMKLRYAANFKKRDHYDKYLASKAKVLIFPSSICKKDYESAYKLLSFRSEASHMVAYPGASLCFQKSAVDKSFSCNTSGENKDGFTFLFVGRGYRTKGLDVLLEACSMLTRKGIKYRLMIAGLKAKAHDKFRLNVLGISKYVQYLGFEKNMQRLYSKANAIVQPSRYETFGMSVLQGMEYGLAPIVSRVSGCSEILSHGQNALILENHLSASELATLMERLIEKPDFARVLSDQAVQTSNNFSWSNTASVVESAYDQVLQKQTTN